MQHPGDGRRDVRQVAAAQHQVGQPVVGVLGAFHRLGVRADRRVGLVELGDGPARLVEQVRAVQGDRRVVGQRRQQRHLVGGELTRRAVGGEEHAEHLRADRQRHAEDRGQALVLDAGVDVPRVLEPVVVEVVGRRVRPRGLRDQPAEALPHAEHDLLELRRHRPVADPHVGLALGLVVEAQVRDVDVQQRPRAAHDRAQHGVRVGQSGQLARGVEQRAELGLAPPVLGERLADPQCQLPRAGQRSQVGRAEGALGTGGHDDVRQLLAARPGGEQVEQPAHRVGRCGHGRHARAKRPPSPPGRPRRAAIRRASRGPRAARPP